MYIYVLWSHKELTKTLIMNISCIIRLAKIITEITKKKLILNSNITRVLLCHALCIGVKVGLSLSGERLLIFPHGPLAVRSVSALMTVNTDGRLVL